MYQRKTHSRIGNILRFVPEEIIPYASNGPKKDFLDQAQDIYRLWRAYGIIPYHYISLGLYAKDTTEDVERYVPPTLIFNLQRKLNNRRCAAHKIHADKVAFRAWMQKVSLPTVVELIHIDRNGRAVSPTFGELEDERAREILEGYPEDLFVKPVDGLQGAGARLIRRERLDAAVLLRERNVLIQPRLGQHEAVSAIYPHAINTVRIDTLTTEDGVVSSAAMLRLGAGGSIIDNSAAGGLAVGIDLATGALRPTARRLSRYGLSRLAAHPDTGAVFAGVKIPFWAELRDVVRRGADSLRPLASLGWDVAITPEGPKLLEANLTWASSALQIASGGLGRTPVGRMARKLHGLPDWLDEASSPSGGAAALGAT